MMKPTAQMQAQLDWFTATVHAGAAARYSLAIGDANKALYFRRDGLKSLSVPDIHHRMGFLKAANSVGVEAARRPLNIYIAASVADPQSWLVMDDLPIEQCRRAGGGRTHMIVQTSPGSHHLWLATSRPVSSPERKACQQVLQRRYGGDAASTSGDHFGRLAGFKNAKRNCWVNFIDAVVSDQRANVDKLLTLANEMVLDSLPHGGFVPSPVLQCVGVAPQARLPSLVSSLPVSSSFSPTGRDESRAEFAFACAHHQKGLDVETGIQSLAQRALSRGKCRTFTAAEKYARLTFNNAAASSSTR